MTAAHRRGKAGPATPAEAAAPLAQPPDGLPAAEEKSLEELIAEDRAAHERKLARLRHHARSSWAAMDGWDGINTPEDWERTCFEASEQYRSGRWLLDRLGTERVIEPLVTATLWRLRQRLLADFGAEDDAAAAMLIDCAVISYHTALKIQQLIGNAVLITEHEFFRDDGPDVRFRRRHGREVADRLVVEHNVEKLVLLLLPLFERANRGLIRNLRALREMKQAPAAPPVAIARANQVNVAGQQIVARGPDEAV